MARGGFRAGSGRPKGSSGQKKSKVVSAMESVLEASSSSPRDFQTAKDFAMWVINNDPDMKNRLQAMQAVLPYTNTKIADAAPGKKDQAMADAKDASSGRFGTRSALRVVEK